MNRFPKIPLVKVNPYSGSTAISAMTIVWVMIMAGLMSAPIAGLAEEAPDPDPQRFASDISKFEKLDQDAPVCPGGTLFIGSSSIRKWDLTKYFPGMRALNRGFGGSQFSDCIHYADRILFPYKPGRIVIYEGDNDINSGKSPCQVLKDFEILFHRIRSELPDAKIYFLAIKPSVSRWKLWPEMQEANLKIKQTLEADGSGQCHYVDVASPMLNENGEITDEWFVDDGLHLNEKGYELWTEILAGLMRHEN